MNQYNNTSNAHNLSVLVQSDRLQLLYKQSYPAVFVSLLSGIFMLIALWPEQSHSILLGWFSVLMFTAVLRLYLFMRYHKEAPQGQEMLSWEKPYFITLFLTSITWGIGALIVMPMDSPLHQAVIFCFLLALSGGAMSLYSSHFTITLTTILAILLPTTIYFMFLGDYVFIVIAVASIVYFMSAIRATRFLDNTLRQNFLMKRQLERSSDEAERLARIDHLTGVYNRRAFYELGSTLINTGQENQSEISIIHMDIDNFKLINDNFGHASGDAVLVQISKILLGRLKRSDIFARIGGEEFGILLPETSIEQAAELAEKLRQEIEKATIVNGTVSFTITASFGVSGGSYDIDALVRQSDEAMYQSKASGRNMITCFRVRDECASQGM